MLGLCVDQGSSAAHLDLDVLTVLLGSSTPTKCNRQENAARQVKEICAILLIHDIAWHLHLQQKDARASCYMVFGLDNTLQTYSTTALQPSQLAQLLQAFCQAVSFTCRLPSLQ